MKTVLFVISIFLLGFSFSQSSTYAFVDNPMYIVGKNYVVYQDAEGRRILHPDMESFKPFTPAGHGFVGMASDKHGIYFKGTFLKMDTTGIEIVGRSNTYPQEWLWKTQKAVFRNTEKLEGADPSTFSPTECLNGGYFKDKNHIYYFDKKIEGSDGKTVNKTCDFEICYDKKNVYYKGEILYFEGDKVVPVNDALFKTKSLVIDKNFNIIEGAQAKHLIRLSERYALDDSHLYFGKDTCAIPSESLKNVKVWDDIGGAFFSDGRKIYASNGQLQKGIDANSFGMLPASNFFYDQNGVYKWAYDANTNSMKHKAIPFQYEEFLVNDHLEKTEHYIIYNTQVYNPWREKLYTNVSHDELKRLKNGGFLSQDVIAPKNKVDTATPVEVFPNTYFSIKESHIFFEGQRLISTNELELLSVFIGYRPGCGSDPDPYTDIYFFRNKEGYWLIETKVSAMPVFLGAVFDPQWNPIFTEFALPK